MTSSVDHDKNNGLDQVPPKSLNESLVGRLRTSAAHFKMQFRFFQFWRKNLSFYLADTTPLQKKMAKDFLRTAATSPNHSLFIVKQNSKIKCVLSVYFPKGEKLASLLGVFVAKQNLREDWRSLQFAMHNFVEHLEVHFANENPPALYWLVPKSENEKWIHRLLTKTQLKGYLTHVAESFARKERVLFDFEFEERGAHARQIPTRWHGSLQRLCSIPSKNLLYHFEYLASQEKVKETKNEAEPATRNAKGQMEFQMLPKGRSLW